MEKISQGVQDQYLQIRRFQASLKTWLLSDEEIGFITWEMNARYYDLEWFRYNKVKRLYPKWFLGETLRLFPFYARRKPALALGQKSMMDLFWEDLDKGGELCEGVT